MNEGLKGLIVLLLYRA